MRALNTPDWTLPGKCAIKRRKKFAKCVCASERGREKARTKKITKENLF